MTENSILLLDPTQQRQKKFAWMDVIYIFYSLLYFIATIGTVIYNWDKQCNDLYAVNYVVIALSNLGYMLAMSQIYQRNKYASLIYAFSTVTLSIPYIYIIYGLAMGLDFCNTLNQSYLYITLACTSLNYLYHCYILYQCYSLKKKKSVSFNFTENIV